MADNDGVPMGGEGANPDYKSVKIPLKRIVKRGVDVQFLNSVVLNINKIVTHTLQFIKLYCLHKFDEHYVKGSLHPVLLDFSTIINLDWIVNVMKTICNMEGGSPTGGTQTVATIASRLDIENFYIEYYKPCTVKEDMTSLQYENSSQILKYYAKDILTNFQNNIISHFVEYVERYVNVIFMKDVRKKSIESTFADMAERKMEMTNLFNDLRNIKRDLLSIKRNDILASDKIDWLNEVKQHVLPYRKYGKDNLKYDLACNPLKYLYSMCFMMKQVENCSTDDYTHALMKVFPLKTSLIPGTI